MLIKRMTYGKSTRRKISNTNTIGVECIIIINVIPL